MNKIIKTKNEVETRAAAVRFGKTLKGGDIVALIGDLGAGKTVWVRGMAESLGIKEIITSPTFILMRCFKIRNPRTRTSSVRGRSQSEIRNFCHVDAYRLKTSQELLNIGLQEYLGAPDTLTVIEWAERAEELLRGKKVIRINFEFGKKEEERVIKISN